MTWVEFLDLPDETRNASLVNGMVVFSPPDAVHEHVIANLHIAFREWHRTGKGRGRTCTQQPLEIDERRGYQMDFAWYPPERCDLHPRGGWHVGRPGLIIEVESSSRDSMDLVRRRNDYERIGIDEVWFVDTPPRRGCVLVERRPSVGEPFVSVELGRRVDESVARGVRTPGRAPVRRLLTVRTRRGGGGRRLRR